jgi:hypothetical protein
MAREAESPVPAAATEISGSPVKTATTTPRKIHPAKFEHPSEFDPPVRFASCGRRGPDNLRRKLSSGTKGIPRSCGSPVQAVRSSLDRAIQFLDLFFCKQLQRPPALASGTRAECLG